MTSRSRAAVVALALLGVVFASASAAAGAADPVASSPAPAQTSGLVPAPAPPASTSAPAAASAPSSEAVPASAVHRHRRQVAAGDLTLSSLGKTSEPLRIALVLTLLALLPALAVCMTPFIRISIVLSMIRHAFGMPETPPNQVLVSLAIFLTIFTMGPTLVAVNSQALQPFLDGSIPVNEAMQNGSAPLKAFMLRQVRDKDLATVYSIARLPLPSRASDVGFMQLTCAFMLNELRVSFKIGFVIMLPFLLIDLVVASILLSLGMIMVPPSTLSLPIKILMFVLIDGWSLVLEGVVGSFR